MTKSKQTKQALFSSLIALILCFSMLLGTTFAWFTDSVSSGVNNIIAGNLDIEVYHNSASVTTPTSIKSETELFRDANGNAMLWEPGAVSYETFTVKNEGTLALKYKLAMNILDYNALDGHTLKEVLKVKVLAGNEMLATIDRTTVSSLDWSTTDTLDVFNTAGSLEAGESDIFQVIIYWAPGANDNNFNMNNGKATSDGQPLFINFGINVVASQLNFENDSFGPDYDQGIALPDLPVSVNKVFQSAPIAGDSVSESVTVKNVSTNVGVATVQAESVNAVISALTAQATDKAENSDLSTVIYLDVQTAGKTETSVTYNIDLYATLTYTDNAGESKTTTLASLNNNLADKIVTATMEIGKGLSNVTVKHHDTPMTQLASDTIDAEGYYYNKTTGVLTIKSKSFSPFTVDYTIEGVAAVGNTTYSTLEDAINAAENGDAVVLLKDIEVSSVIQINKNLTLHLNGFVVTNNVAGDRPFHVVDAVSFEVNGTKAGSAMVIPDTNTASLGFIKISAAATVTLDGGSYIGNTNGGALIRVFAPSDDDPAPDAIITLKNVTATTNKRVFHMDTGDELVLNVIGGTYTATADVPNADSMYSVFGVDCYDLETPLTFTGVTVNTAGGACVESSGCTATYTDCNFTVNETSNPAFTATAVAVSYEGTANIKSGIYTSAGYGISVYSTGGTINVENGTISGGTAAACAYGNDSTINISGGEIIGSLQTGGTGATASISVSGGTFSSNPSAYVADGYEAMSTGNLYVVSQITYWSNFAAASYATPVDTVNKVVTIASAEELALFAKEVSSTTNYSGYTVEITSDIDLGGKRWIPINGSGRMNGIIFNGNNHTISNLTVRNNFNGGVGEYGVGFVGNTNGSITWNDLSFDRAQVSFYKTDYYSGNVGGIVMGYTYGTTVFNNVSVTNSSISGYGKIGAILGMGADPGVQVTFNKCVSKNNTIMAVYDMGGLAGNIQRSRTGVDNTTVNNCTVENITLKLSSNERYVNLINTPATFRTDDRTGDTVSRVLTGHYWVSGRYYYGGYADYYVSYGDSSYDPPITEGDYAGKFIANSEICINISNDNP